MVVDVGARVDDRRNRAFGLVAEIGGQDFDRRRRGLAAERLDDLDELARAAVGQVVAVDRGDDDMRQPNLRRGDRGMFGIEQVDGTPHPRLAVAEGDGARAAVTEDNYRSIIFVPYFLDARQGLHHTNTRTK